VSSIVSPGLLCYKNPVIETANLDRWNTPIRRALATMAREKVMERILARDWTVWKAEDREISTRLGWLDPFPGVMAALPGIEAFAGGIRKAGFTRALVLGMGGSSLAPEVFSLAGGRKRASIPLRILDTTSPAAVARAARNLNPAKTFFIVSSKSGTTAETMALFNFFYDLVSAARGKKRAGAGFTAITDPGTALEDLARRLGFRRIFAGDPAVGGRFSALTVFGLAPAAVAGFDLRGAMAASQPVIQACRSADPERNPAAVLGTILGILARSGIDKAVFPVSALARPFADWLEQLIAESTGKQGKGILPVLENNPEAPGARGRDRIFILTEGPSQATERLRRAGTPMVTVFSEGGLSLPGRFYLWEMAIAVAGHHLGVNPFDQPDVESTKKKTWEALSAPGTGGPAAFGAVAAGPGSAQNLAAFLSGARPGGYIAIQAYLDPAPAIRESLEALRGTVQERTGLPVTFGFGPRYLHSTGQLHKGGSARGSFVQIFGGVKIDVPIPEVDRKRPAPSFGALIRAQALGDWMALREAGRRVIRIDPGRPVARGLLDLARTL
jgi:glucose-6-phosphate isomerase